MHVESRTDRPTHHEARHVREIKRYTNRKLYDMLGSCYVTLDDIAEMIRRGQDVHVIDNRTKEDLTHLTLAQIIFEAQKDPAHLSPLGALRRIIQATSAPDPSDDDADLTPDARPDAPAPAAPEPTPAPAPRMQERIERLERQVLELARLIQGMPRPAGRPPTDGDPR